MKIIKEGKLPENKNIQGTCQNCGTVVEFQVKEAEIIADQRDGGFYKINCPLCKKTISVSQ